ERSWAPRPARIGRRVPADHRRRLNSAQELAQEGPDLLQGPERRDRVVVLDGLVGVVAARERRERRLDVDQLGRQSQDPGAPRLALGDPLVERGRVARGDLYAPDRAAVALDRGDPADLDARRDLRRLADEERG